MESSQVGLPLAGEVVGGTYRVLSVLGEGGMGVVFRALDLSRNAEVALEMIRGDLAQAIDLARFEREAQLAARVDSLAGVVRVHSFGRHKGVPYCAMELVEGRELFELLEDGSVSHDDVARIVERVARTLALCHEAGVVHRDLKPANILVRPDGSPTVVDFGVATALDVERLTRTGDLVGTPEFMAPEQLTGVGIGPLTDVYALGAILYSALAGRDPFSGPVLNVLDAVANEEPPPPASIDPNVSPTLEAICLRAMAKAQSERYQSATALADDLARALRGEPVEATSPTRWTRFLGRLKRSEPRALATVGGVVAALLLALIVAVYFAQRSRLWRHGTRGAEEARALEERTRGWELGFGSGSAPTPTELAVALSAIKEAREVGARSDDLTSVERRLEAHRLLLVHRAGGEVRLTDLASTEPTMSLVRAVVLADRGEHAQALRLAEGACRDAPGWLVGSARATGWRAVEAAVLAIAATAPTDEARHTKRRLDELYAAAKRLKVSPEHYAALAANLSEAVEGHADLWRVEIEKTLRPNSVDAKPTLPVLARLAALFDPTGAKVGPALGAVLDRACRHYLDAWEASKAEGFRGSTRLALGAVRVENAVLYGCWPDRPVPKGFRQLVASLSAQGVDEIRGDVEVLLAVLRTDSRVLTSSGIGGLFKLYSERATKAFFEARPTSRALHYFRFERFRLGELPDDEHERLAEREIGVSIGRAGVAPGLMDDLGPHYRRKLHHLTAREMLGVAAHPFATVDRKALAREALEVVRVGVALGGEQSAFNDLPNFLELEARAVRVLDGAEASDRLFETSAERLRLRVAKATKLGPRNAERLGLGRLLLEHAFCLRLELRWEETEALAREIADLVRGVDGREVHQARFLLAQALAARGDLDGAEDALAPSLSHSEAYDHVDYTIIATQVARDRGDIKAARLRLAAGLSARPTDARLLDLEKELEEKTD